jgi:carbon-monoxide dehydrogenase large subunit
MAVGGSALHAATGKIISKGKKIAAHLLETAVSDIEFAAGEFRVAGTDRKVVFADVARAAYVPHNYPLDSLEPGLDENAFYDPPNFAFSNGVHVCEVEVDPETGAAQLVSYHAVDDVGTVINPMIVEGQLHGGLAQGIGQALAELDESQPCTHNPLGAKGCGESGAIGAPAAVMSALLDALAPLGIMDLEMPATPHRIWQAIMRK